MVCFCTVFRSNEYTTIFMLYFSGLYAVGKSCVIKTIGELKMQGKIRKWWKICCVTEHIFACRRDNTDWRFWFANHYKKMAHPRCKNLLPSRVT